MRIQFPLSQTSPLPHENDPPPLLRSPTSILGLTASDKRRRKNFVRASSSEPTVAGGLANWRRQPKQSGSGTGTTNTGSAGTSETKKARRGVGMGMQGTPAKKGKRSTSKSMGVHSTPTAKIKSRTQSLSQGRNVTDGVATTAESSASSLDSSFPSSADLNTLSPQSHIPDLSSPSIPAIRIINRKPDIFDDAYVASPKERTSEEIEDFERGLDDAQADASDGEHPDDEQLRDEGDGLFGWQEDVLWSLRGSTESEVDQEGVMGVDDEEGQEETIAPDGTIYHDVLMSMNDDSEQSTSPSSRTKRRSTTIQNRQPTPHKRSAESSDQRTMAKKASRASTGPANLDSSQSSAGDETFYTAKTGRQSLDLSDAQVPTRAPNSQRNESAQKSKSAPSAARAPDTGGLPSSGKDKSHSNKASMEVDALLLGSALDEDSLQPSQPDQSTLSQLLNYTDPVPPGVTLSKLLQSTQSAKATQEGDPKDESVELGRGEGIALPDYYDDPLTPLPGHPSDPHVPAPGNQFSDTNMDGGGGGPSSEGAEPFYLPVDGSEVGDPFKWKLGDGFGVPTPYTPSSHLSPRSVAAPLSPISFATTRSPSIQQLLTPPPPTWNSSKKKRRIKLVGKGAWRGAEVLARMEEANRLTAKYHMAFDRASRDASEDEDGDGRGTSSAKDRASRVKVVYEESEDVLDARRKRIEHYKELETGYKLHVELVL